MMSFLWSIPVEVGAWWAASCDMVLAGRREKVDQWAEVAADGRSAGAGLPAGVLSM